MEPTSLIWMSAIVATALAGWMLGRRRSGGGRTKEALTRLAEELRLGRLPGPESDGGAEMVAVGEALAAGWTARNEEREQALREALGRIAAFLREEVRGPLEAANGKSEDDLQDGLRRALGGLDDLEFFLREPLTPDETHDLIPLVQQVTREFTKDWEVAVRLRVDGRPVRAHIHRDSFMDAVYLLLHNAGQFGGGKTVDVVVLEDRGRARITMRDQGPGFTPEALERARDLFYTTTETNLGLGIPFARRIIESFGGDIDLKNLGDGRGAEVSLGLPIA